MLWIQLHKEQLQYGMHGIILAKGKSKTQICTPQKDMYNLDQILKSKGKKSSTSFFLIITQYRGGKMFLKLKEHEMGGKTCDQC